MSDLANIGPTGQRQRRLLGTASLAGTVVALLALERFELGRWWRLATFPLWTLGALGFMQAQARTCVAFAAQGTCDPEIGRLTPTELQSLARRGSAILRNAALIASAVTLLTLALP